MECEPERLWARLLSDACSLWVFGSVPTHSATTSNRWPLLVSLLMGIHNYTTSKLCRHLKWQMKVIAPMVSLPLKVKKAYIFSGRLIGRISDFESDNGSSNLPLRATIKLIGGVLQELVLIFRSLIIYGVVIQLAEITDFDVFLFKRLNSYKKL